MDTAAAAPTPSPGSDELAKFVDEYFDAQFAFSPTSGTSAGMHQYDSQIEDRSRARLDARVAQLKEFLARLKAMDRSHFSFMDTIDARAIEADIRGTLMDLETLRVYDTNPMYYAGIAGGAVGEIIKRDFAPAEERLRSVTARLRGVPAIYEAARANLNNPPEEFTDLAIRMAEGTTGYFEGTARTWAKDAAGRNAQLLADFNTANDGAIKANREFATWLEKDLLPRS